MCESTRGMRYARVCADGHAGTQRMCVREETRNIHSASGFRTSRISRVPYNTVCAVEKKSQESRANLGTDFRNERMKARTSTSKGGICDSSWAGGRKGETGPECNMHALAFPAPRSTARVQTV